MEGGTKDVNNGVVTTRSIRLAAKSLQKAINKIQLFT